MHQEIPLVSWYLRSASDWDTHRGVFRQDGLVAAQCGIRFKPRPLAFGRTALPGNPLDPDQICPGCLTTLR